MRNKEPGKKLSCQISFVTRACHAIGPLYYEGLLLDVRHSVSDDMIIYDNQTQAAALPIFPLPPIWSRSLF